MTRLTAKQEVFAQLVAKGKNQVDAYIDAYYPKGRQYNEKTVNSGASKLANNEKIKARIKEIKKDKASQKSLTLKEEAFLNAYLEGKALKDAYIQAFGRGKYTDKSLYEKASHLFHSDKIQARYEVLHDQIVTEAKERAVMKEEDVLNELSAIASVNVTDFMDWSTDKKNKFKLTAKDAAVIDGRLIKSITIDKFGNPVIVFHDKVRALQQLAAIYGMTEQDSTSENAVELLQQSFEGMEV